MSSPDKILAYLFAIKRTILGDGFDKSLEAIQEYVGANALVTSHQLATGTTCGTWTILPKWTINRAVLKDGDGQIIADAAQDPHHVWSYSKAFTGRITAEELESHLVVSKAPKHIPALVSYYADNWGFSIDCDVWRDCNKSQFDVQIDAEFEEGHLSIGECFIQGQSDKVILIDAVLSFPQLANNLTGAAIASALIKHLSARERYYSYRILFTPETIGPIAIHYHFPHLFENVVGGMSLINFGLGDGYHYKQSRAGNCIVDKALNHFAAHSSDVCTIAPYDVKTGQTGNEKAYNSLGINVPIGRLCASIPGTYDAYDTSADNLDYISKTRLEKSLKDVLSIMEIIDMSAPVSHMFEGEPFLSGFALFDGIKTDDDRLPFDYLMAFADGTETLLTIADKMGKPVKALLPAAEKMLAKNLIYFSDDITVFKSSRLIFKELIPQDASQEYVGWLADEKVNRYLETRDTNQKEIKEYIYQRRIDRNCLFLGIFDRITLAHIGNVKLEPIDWDAHSAVFGILIGNSDYWNKGIGSEATAAIVNHGFTALKLSMIELGVLTKNVGAVKAYEKVGFKTVSTHMRKRDGFDELFEESTMQVFPETLHIDKR